LLSNNNRKDVPAVFGMWIKTSFFGLRIGAENTCFYPK